MIRKIIFSVSIVFLLSSLTFAKKTLSADEILQKTAAKLSSLKMLKYKYHQEYNYKSEAFFAESKAESFLDFTPVESAVGLRFQFDDEVSVVTYNGSEKFSLNKKDKTIQIEAKPTGEKLSSSSYLQFAFPMWRNILPQIIADKTIAKSISETNNKSGYLIEFALDKAYIDSGLGAKIFPMTIDRKTVYRLTIDKNSFLPVEVYRGNNVNQDFNKVTLSEIVENPTPPIENSWYYSTYLNEYKYAKPPADNLIKTGETAHNISLPMFGANKTVSLNDYKGKIILLEFWIFHCGACQASVPKLNALQEKFKDKNFQLLTVNIADSEKQIELFIELTKPAFPIIYQGESIAKQYGVWFYPTVVLIGEDGKIIYSGEFEKTKIEELIGQNLH